MEESINFDLNELFEMEKKIGKKFDYLRLSFSDLNGILRSILVPRRHLEKSLSSGFDVFSGRIASSPLGDLVVMPEVQNIQLGNLYCFPCNGTLHLCSWASNKNDEENWLIGGVLAEVKWPLSYKQGSLLEACPRFALRRQLNKLGELGFQLKSAFEIEFSLFQPDPLKPVFNSKSASSLSILASFQKYLCTVEKHLEKSGFDVSSIKVEHGEGQFELVLEPELGVKTADKVSVVKEAIREMSALMGYKATFMSSPSVNCSPNGFHLNLSLWQNGPEGGLRNSFFDASQPDHLSTTCRHFLAGLLKHSKALTAFCCPTVNCYRRLHSYTTPYKINWGYDDRLTSYRIKNTGMHHTYIENRLPSASCNPYLATAATLAAGIDGIVKRLPLQAAEGEVSKEECVSRTKHDDSVPFTLKESLLELEENEVMKKSLGEELVRWFVRLKKVTELDRIKALKDDEKFNEERKLYFDFI